MLQTCWAFIGNACGIGLRVYLLYREEGRHVRKRRIPRGAGGTWAPAVAESFEIAALEILNRLNLLAEEVIGLPDVAIPKSDRDARISKVN